MMHIYTSIYLGTVVNIAAARVAPNTVYRTGQVKGMEHVPNIFMSFDKYLFLEVINILI